MKQKRVELVNKIYKYENKKQTARKISSKANPEIKTFREMCSLNEYDGALFGLTSLTTAAVGIVLGTAFSLVQWNDSNKALTGLAVGGSVGLVAPSLIRGTILGAQRATQLIADKCYNVFEKEKQKSFDEKRKYCNNKFIEFSDMNEEEIVKLYVEEYSDFESAKLSILQDSQEFGDYKFKKLGHYITKEKVGKWAWEHAFHQERLKQAISKVELNTTLDSDLVTDCKVMAENVNKLIESKKEMIAEVEM